jgi:hypothetical protein
MAGTRSSGTGGSRVESQKAIDPCLTPPPIDGFSRNSDPQILDGKSVRNNTHDWTDRKQPQ